MIVRGVVDQRRPTIRTHGEFRDDRPGCIVEPKFGERATCTVSRCALNVRLLMDHTGRFEDGASLLNKGWVAKVVGGLDVLAERVLEACDGLRDSLRQRSDSSRAWHGNASVSCRAIYREPHHVARETRFFIHVLAVEGVGQQRPLGPCG